MNFADSRPEWGERDSSFERRGRRGRGRQDRGHGAFGPIGHHPEGEGRRGRGRGRAPFDSDGMPGFGPGPRGGMPPFPESPFGPGGPRGRRGRGRARRGDVRLAVIALLAEETANGYQLIRALADRTGGAWRPSPGAVYPALSQLEDEGLIRPIEVDGQKVFELTDAGRTAAAEIETPPWDAVNEQHAPRDAEGAAGFQEEFGRLAMAARAVGMSGTPAQVKAATDLVAETRRRLFGLLAEDERAGDTD
ncbi:MAG: PadR family transcriptional regulator [Micrococcales bacterium]|nr:PadR family transcriptional regulator [Micrococcales bacterium]